MCAFQRVNSLVRLLCGRFNGGQARYKLGVRLALFLLLLAVSAFLISRKNALEIVEHAFRPAEPEPGKKLWLPITLLLVWCIISFSQVSTFIYFNF